MTYLFTLILQRFIYILNNSIHGGEGFQKTRKTL